MKVLTREEALAIYHRGPEAVVKIICELSQRVVILEEENKRFKERLEALENRLALNSRNSSKPPSSDGYQKPNPKSLREKTGRKPGGQEGHEGHTLERVKNPDHIQLHKVEGKCGCGHSLKDEKAQDIESRQVFDLPKINIEVTEHRVEIKTCSKCGEVHKGIFPDEAQAGIQYGLRIKAAVIYLRGYQLLPFQRLTELFAELFGCRA